MDSKWNYTMLAENRWDELKNKFKCLPKESALALLDNISRSKGKSDYYSRLSELLESCGLECDLAHSKSIKDIALLINDLPTKQELSDMMLEELYKLYRDYKTPGEYMERIVKNIADEDFADDTVRVAILKQFVRYLQKDGKSSHGGVTSVIKYVKSENKDCKSTEDVIKCIDENIFVNTDGCYLVTDKQKEEIQILCNKLSDTAVKDASENKTVRRINTIFNKSYLNESDLKQIKEFGNNLADENDEEEAKKIFAKLSDNLKIKQCTDMQKSIIDSMNEAFSDDSSISWEDKKNIILEFVLIFKNTTSENSNEKYVSFYIEQLRMIQKIAEIIKRRRGEILLYDARERIRSFAEHVYKQLGKTKVFEELMIDNIRVLLNALNHKGSVMKRIESFVTQRIEISKDKFELVDRLYRIIKKNGMTAEQKECVDRLKKIISDISETNISAQSGMAEVGKRLLKTADDLASCTFRTNGSTRKDLYIFAFAFGLKIYRDKSSPEYDKFSDIENLFFDVYNDDLFRYLEESDFRDSNAIPNGEGVNYKNFAEAICLYYLTKEEPLTRYERYEKAMKCIELCKEKSGGHSEDTGNTVFYKKLYWDEILNVNENNLIDFVRMNYYVPAKPTEASECAPKSGIIPITEEAIEELTGEKMKPEETVRLCILKQFIKCGFTGDAKITGVTTFRKKAVENGFDGIVNKSEVIDKVTDASIDLFMNLKMKDDDKILGRLVKNLASGEFLKYSTARENLYKFAFVFGMKLFESDSVDGYEEKYDVEKNLLLKYYDTGINFDEKLDTVCAYYLVKDGMSPQDKLKKAFTLIKSKEIEELNDGEVLIADRKSYFFSNVVNMSEAELSHYVLSQFGGGAVFRSVNDFDVLSDEITAYELYNQIFREVSEFEASEYGDDEDNGIYIRSELRDDIERIHYEFRNDYLHKYDSRFFEMLKALENMVKLNKDVNRKNINRTDFIVLEYYKILMDLSEEIFDLEETYTEVIDYIDEDLKEARFRPLDPKNMFDLYVICMVYRKIMTTPEF